MIKINVFEKTRYTHEGKPFKVFTSQLTKKDGTKLYVNVKFRKDAGQPEAFPAVINIFEGNVSTKNVNDPITGTVKIYYTLWVKKWTPTNEEYKDHSLDEFI